MFFKTLKETLLALYNVIIMWLIHPSLYKSSWCSFMYGVMQKINPMDYEKIKLSSKTQLRLRKLFKLKDFDKIQLELFDSPYWFKQIWY